MTLVGWVAVKIVDCHLFDIKRFEIVYDLEIIISHLDLWCSLGR